MKFVITTTDCLGFYVTNGPRGLSRSKSILCILFHVRSKMFGCRDPFIVWHTELAKNYQSLKEDKDKSRNRDGCKKFHHPGIIVDEKVAVRCHPPRSLSGDVFLSGSKIS